MRRNKKFLEACRGAQCYLRIEGVCIGGTDTVVPAHSNQSRHGKGMGIKAKDTYSLPACHACHYEIDQGNTFTKAEKFAFWDAGFVAWEHIRNKKLRGNK